MAVRNCPASCSVQMSGGGRDSSKVPLRLSGNARLMVRLSSAIDGPGGLPGRVAEAGRCTQVACGRCGGSRARCGCQCSEVRRQWIGTRLRGMGSGRVSDLWGRGAGVSGVDQGLMPWPVPQPRPRHRLRPRPAPSASRSSLLFTGNRSYRQPRSLSLHRPPIVHWPLRRRRYP